MKENGFLCLVASLAYKVGRAECGENQDAAAKRSRLVVVLSVSRKGRELAIVAAVGFNCSTLEQSATVGFGKGGESQPEDDCTSCDYLFHYMLVYLMINF